MLQPFLSDMPVITSKPRHAPVGTFSIARVSQTTPWMMKAVKPHERKLPKGVIVARRPGDMARHATVVLA
ncbi:MAG TPA: hypothetical protein VFN67_39510 [Polyangiales bacterium]|nr:hypothetical protein [Polyangiales bacterium]